MLSRGHEKVNDTVLWAMRLAKYKYDIMTMYKSLWQGQGIVKSIIFNTACKIQNLLCTYFGAEPNKMSYFLSIGKKIYVVFETLPDLLSFLHRLI
jgi:hypothetical protein